MVKIIKNPEPVKCDNCGCIFSYEASDVQHDVYMDRYGFLGMLPLSKRCKAVRCPICNEPYIIQRY